MANRSDFLRTVGRASAGALVFGRVPDAMAQSPTFATASDWILNPAAVAKRSPRIVIGSWCGLRFNPDFVRPGPVGRQ